MPAHRRLTDDVLARLIELCRTSPVPPTLGELSRAASVSHAATIEWLARGRRGEEPYSTLLAALKAARQRAPRHVRSFSYQLVTSPGAEPLVEVLVASRAFLAQEALEKQLGIPVFIRRVERPARGRRAA
jgi:hypothetical protein